MPDTGPAAETLGGLRWIRLRRQMALLVGEWREMFRPRYLPSDVMAAVAVALVALPLSLAIANASGVRPEVGLTTAIVGGIVVALFGGSRLQVSGPAAAMTFLVYEILTKYRPEGLIAATLLAGILQVATGLSGLGRVMQFVPRPVVAGFLTGIGLTILCTQLPVILGYDVGHDEEGGAVGLLIQTVRGVGRTDVRALAVGVGAVLLMVGLPRLDRRLPAPLLAVLGSTALAWSLGWAHEGAGSIGLLGELPGELPRPRWPEIPWDEFNELVVAGMALFVLASIESLLSASVVETMARDVPRVDHDQELIGQGLGNLASAMFGGIPVTGVIARSATNVQSGARTRLAAILHALLILVMMMVLARPVGWIPLATLAGVLVAVALRMIEVRLLWVLWQASRAEAAVFLVTTATILVTDLIVGVPVGLMAALLYVIWEMSALRVRTATGDEVERMPAAQCPAVRVIEVDGPLFFGSGYPFRNLMAGQEEGVRYLILDLHLVPLLDVTGAVLLEELIERLSERGVVVHLARPRGRVRRRLALLRTAAFETLRKVSVHETIDEALESVGAELAAVGGCGVCPQRGGCGLMGDLGQQVWGRERG
ncbi:MAG: sulfate permease [Isosphaeraceae bacterium]|jgi:high affinity sulfate transporter 1|nr:MAG: sulfate permease [Isosphaeraceae bacterium]